MGGTPLILLDTHIWIWANLEPQKLPEKLVKAFQKEEAEFAISVVSVWETLVAMEKGRVETVATPESTVRAWLGGNPFKVITLDTEIAMLSRTLPFIHDDPADRFIAATSYRLGCPLATVDNRLQSLSWLSTF